MKLILCALIFIACLSFCCCESKTWDEYKEEYGLSHENEEAEAQHRKNFEKSLKVIKENNDKAKTRAGGKEKFGMKLNGLAHLTKEEKMQGLFGLPKDSSSRDKKRLLINKGTAKLVTRHYPFGKFPGEPKGYTKPEFLDWNERGAVQKNNYTQNPCNTCSIFAATAVLESQLFLREKKKIKLSEQFTRQCVLDPKYSDWGTDACAHGVYMDNVFQLASEVPIPTAAEVPYIQDRELRPCKLQKGTSFSSITDIVHVEGEEQMLEALRTVGPLATSLDASELAFDEKWNKWDGKTPSVYTSDKCDMKNQNHAVLLVGYGTDKTFGKYWLIRNSWGPSWADNGFFKIKRGICAIYDAFYPAMNGQYTLGKDMMKKA